MTEKTTITVDNAFMVDLGMVVQNHVTEDEDMHKLPGMLVAMISLLAGTMNIAGLSKDQGKEFLDEVFDQVWDKEDERSASLTE